MDTIYILGAWAGFFAGGCDPTRSRTKWAPKTRASRVVWGHAPFRKFWKLDCLRLNLVSFEGSMIWKRQPIAMLLKMFALHAWISKYVDICLKSGKSDNVCKKTFYNNNLFEIILGILRNVLIRNQLNHQIVEPCTHEGELRVIMCIN